MLLRLTAAWARRRRDAAAASIDFPSAWPPRPTSTGRAALAALVGAHSLMTIGRGPTLAIAREAALKLKETCDLHAEAFSSAEFQHGPIALVEPAYPVLMFMPADAAAAGHRDAARRICARKGAAVFSTGKPAPAACSSDTARRIIRTPMRSA